MEVRKEDHRDQDEKVVEIAPSIKMIMNLCKQDRLDAWGSLRVVFT